MNSRIVVYSDLPGCRADKQAESAARVRKGQCSISILLLTAALSRAFAPSDIIETSDVLVFGEEFCWRFGVQR